MRSWGWNPKVRLTPYHAFIGRGRDLCLSLSLSAHAPRTGHVSPRQEGSYLQARKRDVIRTESVDTLFSDTPVSRTTRNKFLIFKLPIQWFFCFNSPRRARHTLQNPRPSGRFAMPYTHTHTRGFSILVPWRSSPPASCQCVKNFSIKLTQVYLHQVLKIEVCKTWGFLEMCKRSNSNWKTEST